MNKLVILDRDGVINYDSSDYIKSVDEWQPIPHSIEAIALLQQKGYKVALATNQSGIGRGLYSLDTFFAIQEKLASALQSVNAKLDKTAYCPHLPTDNCPCRKPKPGMLLEILDFFKIDPAQNTVFFVGDSATDLTAAISANCQPVLVKTGKGLATLAKLENPQAIQVFADLMEFAKNL